MSKGGLDQYGAEPFEQQQFGTAGVEGVKVQRLIRNTIIHIVVVVTDKMLNYCHKGDKIATRNTKPG